MNHPRMRAFAASLGIEIADTNHFFALLSDSGKKAVDLETFVTGCIRMKGQALSVDLQDLLIKQNRFTQTVEKKLEAIRQQLTLILQYKLDQGKMNRTESIEQALAPFNS